MCLISYCIMADNKMLGRYIKYSSDGKKLRDVVNSDERFKCVERQVVDIINAVTSSKVRYSERES